MIEQDQSKLFNIRETYVQPGGLELTREPGEGFIISGFGQIFLITYDENVAKLGFQSPTDFNHVEMNDFKMDTSYFVGDKKYIKLYKFFGDNSVVFRMTFPKENRIFKQENTSITQNLMRPI